MALGLHFHLFNSEYFISLYLGLVSGSICINLGIWISFALFFWLLVSSVHLSKPRFISIQCMVLFHIFRNIFPFQAYFFCFLLHNLGPYSLFLAKNWRILLHIVNIKGLRITQRSTSCPCFLEKKCRILKANFVDSVTSSLSKTNPQLRQDQGTLTPSCGSIIFRIKER